MVPEQTNPFEVLGISPDADEQQVRQRYLQLVRENPPDRAPEKFAAIRAAYEQVKDPAVVLESRLFRPQAAATMESLLVEAREQRRNERLPTAVLLSLAD